ncbi:MAG: APC family permease, partial [Candidatus Woesearchaeota archaeon]|nr:APC family permease [Candidatus Woesearchaeota archaeon]
GSYTVAMENLGVTPGLAAASSLLLDYILTVSVSVAAGVAALTSAFPGLFPHRVFIGVCVVIFIMIMNLKGVKESGLFFSVPTYLFIGSYVAMIGVGFYRFFTGTLTPTIIQEQVPILSSISLFLLLRAFSGGCTALTGVEAISNGVLAFKKPEAQNAKKTLTVMAIIITVLVFGIAFLANQLHIHPEHSRTLVSLIAENMFGRTWFYFLVQATTMMILFLAANTSFADFPRLCYFHARDGFMPRQFTQLGDRLVYTYGIIFLAFFSSLLIIGFHGSVHMLIPLYAIGVFTSFSLSQAGMIKRHFTLRKKGWVKSIIINGIGFVLTTIVLFIILITKFMHGAWVIIVLVAFFNFLFKGIKRHYESVAEQLTVSDLKAPLKLKKNKHMMIVLVPSFHKGIIQALEFARTFCHDVQAVHVDISGKERDRLMEKWKKYVPDMKLIVLDSPYRVLTGRLMEYLDELEKKDKTLNVTVVIPEFVPKIWWHHILHNQTALALKTAIHFRKRTSYISVQYHLRK